MASINKITEIIAGIKTIYSYYAKDTDIATLVKTWNILLKDYPDEAVELAFYKCLQTCKVPPTPADVIEKLNAMLEANEPTEEELWEHFTKALKKTEKQVYYFNFTFRFPGEKLSQGEQARQEVEKIWDALPEKIKRYIGGKGELIRLARTYTDDELKFEKNRFIKTMPQIKIRQEYIDLNSLLNGEQQQRIEGGEK